MTVAPRDAQVLLGLPGLKEEARRAGVRLQTREDDDGWLHLTLRGSAAAIAAAKAKVESVLSSPPVTPTTAPAAGEERRVDPADGVAYTRDEFVAEYGGTREWEAAKPLAPAKATAPQPPPPSGPSAAVAALSAPPWHGDGGDDGSESGDEDEDEPELVRGEGGIYQIVIGVVGREGLPKLLANGGQMIRRMRQATGADIEFEAYIPQSLDDPPKRLIVSGSAQSCISARVSVMEVLGSDKSRLTTAKIAKAAPPTRAPPTIERRETPSSHASAAPTILATAGGSPASSRGCGSPASSIRSTATLPATPASATAAPSAAVAASPPPAAPAVREVSVSSTGTVNLEVRRDLVGRIIGSRGATISHLRESTGAVIELDKDVDGTGILTVAGAPAAVQQARAAIDALVAAADTPVLRGGRSDDPRHRRSRSGGGGGAPAAAGGGGGDVESETVWVPAARVGKVIGSRGAVIQGIRQATGAQVDLEKDRLTGDAEVTIRGTTEAIQAARQSVQAIIDLHDA